MNSKVIISGCSYSHIPNGSYGTYLNSVYGYDVLNISYSGQSNDSILKKIYDFIKLNKISNSVVICQLTYLHRVGWYHNLNSQWMDYQPEFINKIPVYKNDQLDFDYDMSKFSLSPYNNKYTLSEFDYTKLKEMYNTWLSMVYDDNGSFDYLLYKIDTLQSYIEKTKNKILFIYWPEIQNEYQLNELKNRNFLSINKEYSILKWSVKNNMIGDDSHLSNYGCNEFAELLNNELRKYMNTIFNKNKTII
jgi:hypothetical protein